MRPVLLATTCALALASGLGLAACGGGGDYPSDKVPAKAPALLPPDDANVLATSGSSASDAASTTNPSTTSTDTGGTTPTDTGGSTPSDTGGTDTGTGNTGGTDTGGGNTGGTDTGGGNTGGTDTGGGDTGGTAPDTGGVSPDQNAGAGSFQQFCRDNPGAC